jgi:8-oxo-dGTP pyrophosphatase MutT (NUDIX family)
MAGKYVFPGGVVEPSDDQAAVWQKHIDIGPDEIQTRLGGDLTGAEALSYAVAAIRETFEETGVLLADPPPPSDPAFVRAQHMRLADRMSAGWFLRFAESNGWILALSTMSPWSHWITPTQMKRRYNTRFFVAVMPSGQVCRPDNREVTHGLWISPSKGLAANLTGEIPLSPPTIVVLNELLTYSSMAELLTSIRHRAWGSALLPRLISLPKGALIIEPWDDDYANPDISIDPLGLENKVLPAGEAFSRLWFNAGLWRPVRV